VVLDLTIDVERVTEDIADFIKTRIGRAGAAGAVLGLSGGLDSATAAFLAVRALGPERIWPLLLPYRTSSPATVADAELVANLLGLSLTTCDVTPQIEAYFRGPAGRGHGTPPSPLRVGNKVARERMSVLYDQAKARGALVLGTGNRSERLLGYTTLWGDMACDLAPLGHLYKTQVRQLAGALGLPTRILDKAPTADLWPGQTDEGELGISYQRADELLHLLVDRRLKSAEVAALGYQQAEIARVRHLLRSSAHKRRLPPCPPLVSMPARPH
jgi:NAD+ synthase